MRRLRKSAAGRLPRGRLRADVYVGNVGGVFFKPTSCERCEGSLGCGRPQIASTMLGVVPS